MNKFFKSFLMIGLIAVIFWLCFSFYDRQFRLSNVKDNWPLTHSTSISVDQQTLLKNIFSQPFYYLDRGKQSYVFISRDQRYVLKFFDTRCLRSGNFPFLFQINPKKCAKKLKQLIEGYQAAESYEWENTGLLFVQLAPDPSYSLNVTIRDRFNIKHKINLAEVPFAIQQTAIPLRELITSLLSKGKVEEAKERLRQIIDMYVQGYQNGILDLDHNFMYNTGFVRDQAIRIDLGRLQKSEKIKDPLVYQKDLDKIVNKRLADWLERHFPKYRKEILDNMQKKLKEISENSQSPENTLSRKPINN